MSRVLSFHYKNIRHQCRIAAEYIGNDPVTVRISSHRLHSNSSLFLQLIVLLNFPKVVNLQFDTARTLPVANHYTFYEFVVAIQLIYVFLTYCPLDG